MKSKKTRQNSFKKEGKAVSPAISAVIITAVTIVLVLVAGNYAYQVLERQRGASELEAVKKSFISFDDAVRDVAWDKSGARSARFTLNYGSLEVIPANAQKGLLINVTVDEYPYNDAKYIDYTGYLRYNISTNYVTFGDKYKSYMLGDDKAAISKGTENFGVALIEQRSKWVSITLCYRVRVMRTSVVEVHTTNGDYTVNYVEILIIKIVTSKWYTYIGDFDLVARNVAITTKTSRDYDVAGKQKCNVSVSVGCLTNSRIPVDLDPGTLDKPGKVVFNFVVAEVYLGT
ncbi:MAG: hypothetical protein QW717_03525 [Candidatus Bathyarchaeia archaeon]